ncbi:MAG: hypothetical protein CVT49_06155 [candidate division Zixibacteria bacterium HGW-Zixibacteria-1]|nr:MAG: hypothetical protein CVT49_06155 [candidate division Zixibacteria bacterium HGW-Zixibacteria-1]
MKLPVYVTVEEVQRVCKELKISDWTRITKPAVSESEAAIVLKEIDAGDMKVNLEDFRQGLEVELEHGVMFSEANVTNNHPVLTGKIVLAHFKETLDYYKRLDVAEIEGDIFKAVKAGKIEKLDRLYRKLIAAKKIMADTEADQIG